MGRPKTLVEAQEDLNREARELWRLIWSELQPFVNRVARLVRR